MHPYIVNCESIAEGYIGIKNIQHFHWLLHSYARILWRGFICRFYDKLNLVCWSLNPLPPKLNRLSFFLTSHFWGLPLENLQIVPTFTFLGQWDPSTPPPMQNCSPAAWILTGHMFQQLVYSGSPWLISRHLKRFILNFNRVFHSQLCNCLQWIWKYAFTTPPISQQDYWEGDTEAQAKRSSRTIDKIQEALKFMRNQQFEVPFIAFYRKEYVEPELNINDLWRIYSWDEKWAQLKNRRSNLLKLIDQVPVA